MVRRSLEAHDEPAQVKSFQAELSTYMKALGKKGGKASGAKRMQMPVEERRRIASDAARTRWEAVAKRKAVKKR